MVYIRTKIQGGKEYYYLVEGKKDKLGKVKQKVLAYIGDKEKLERLYENIGEKIGNSKGL